uniref:Uncharacterized protein n=1 Tax=Pseudomonas aeruginosa TaxID=287 RepID=B3G2J8_PSEAI|nr:hypothetical protein PACL_0472 [Pseudomonas aeruginosa]
MILRGEVCRHVGQATADERIVVTRYGAAGELNCAALADEVGRGERLGVDDVHAEGDSEVALDVRAARTLPPREQRENVAVHEPLDPVAHERLPRRATVDHVDRRVLDDIADGSDPPLLGVERGVVEVWDAGHGAGQVDAAHHAAALPGWWPNCCHSTLCLRFLVRTGVPSSFQSWTLARICMSRHSRVFRARSMNC